MVKDCEAIFRAGERPTGIVSGSGIHLRPLLDEVVLEVPFAEVDGVATASVAGHDGHFVFGRCGGFPVVLQAGRIHLYEGHGYEAVTATVDALRSFGVDALILTNAAGGLAPELAPGDWVAADQVLAWRFAAHAFPERMTPDFIVPGCRATGSYIWMHGPCYETRAEIRALQAMGGITVGMSVAPELERCRQLGMRAGVVSCVTNNCTTQESLSHVQVVDAARKASEHLCEILREFIGDSEQGRQNDS
jgi:purine-nucleoside phosphorylase